MKFNCTQCGECCRHLDLSALYADLDSGNGTCRFLKGNLCSIYENRPLKCRVEECYRQFFAKEVSIEDYYRMNYEMCKKLKKLKARRENKCHYH